MSVTPEEVEKVAFAIWEATGHRGSDWIYMAPEIPRKRRYMAYAAAALSAAAPLIEARAKAEALQEAADEIQGDNSPGAFSKWLRARAATLQEETR